MTDIVQGNLFSDGIKRILNIMRNKKQNKTYSPICISDHMLNWVKIETCVPFKQWFLSLVQDYGTELGVAESRDPRVNLDKRYSSVM